MIDLGGAVKCVWANYKNVGFVQSMWHKKAGKTAATMSRADKFPTCAFYQMTTAPLYKEEEEVEDGGVASKAVDKDGLWSRKQLISM